MKTKTFNCISVGAIILLLLTVSIFNAYIDPCFHFHAPLEKGYELFSEEYQNNGIAQHFAYNAIITGTSMAENFKVTELEQKFRGVQAVKLPLAGGYYGEINNILSTAYDSENCIRIVIRSLDMDESMLIANADAENPRRKMPKYLYNGVGIDDMLYLLNKEILLKSLCAQKDADEYEDKWEKKFDLYGSWYGYSKFGKQEVLKKYERPEKIDTVCHLTENEERIIETNIEKNILEMVRQHPETDFYLFIPPYSILFWDGAKQRNQISYWCEIQKVVIEQLLQEKNIILFSYMDMYEWTSNLDNYRDLTHYNEQINSLMLTNMALDRGRLTEDNYEEYLKRIYEYYNYYDFDSIFS